MKEDILLFGNPMLNKPCLNVINNDAQIDSDKERLFATLQDFRQSNGWGRAIAAPQLGILKRMVAVDLGDGPFLMINPKITDRSAEMFTVWDDCMSMPTLLVQVERHLTIDVEYMDELFQIKSFKQCSPQRSELFQHEFDHLDGIVMTDRLISDGAIIHRSQRDNFENQSRR